MSFKATKFLSGFFLFPALLGGGVSYAFDKGFSAQEIIEEETIVLEERAPAEVIQELKAIQESGVLLYDVLQLTYQNNPTLQAARAEMRAVEEKLPQASAGYKPYVSADADITYSDSDSKGAAFGTTDGDNTSKTVGVNLDQPIFKGGSTMAAVSGARNIIAAQRQRLKAIEQNILLDAVTSYMNVLRDAALLRLSENNREFIARQLEATQDRFTVGELSRTDVSQAEARLAGAEADIITTRGDLRSSMAVYEQVIGVPPEENLLYPELRIVIPDNLQDVVSLAETQNPDILAAEFSNAAAEENVDEIFGELLPQLSLKGGISKSYDPQIGLDEQDRHSIGLQASIPLYESGSIRSRVREAKATSNQRFMQIMETRRRARQEAISNWESLKATEAEIRSRQAQVEASAIAQEGVHYETEFGQRSVLDALDADQEYLDAQVGLVTARRNEVIARFALAGTMGLLTPENLGFSVEKAEKQPGMSVGRE